MNNLKKLILLFGISASLFLSIGVSSTSVYANTNVNQASQTILGGWDEETGIFYNQNNVLVSEVSVFRAAKSDPLHSGKREDRFQKNGLESRAVGWTSWPSVYHYTRAQMVELKGLGGVAADSGRIWGTGGTQAYSGWVFEGELSTHIAKTFYGK
ncbi:hypothetical protein SAMN02910293_00363 [Streptococcus henryi]|uniref:Bacteriocin (Lactococcin_972) n=1 Tax=Streptococcus henryi TaxID=439219 RepID=A0A1G6AFW2_9STRE|nr:hypothetical protein [Streptococcus henryi]SDB07309.1 hypothetical protein SAMN02910293_00363 [Streptococcus henryi]